MVRHMRINLVYIFLFNLLFINSHCQSFDDSIMIANSVRWNVDYKKGLFTFSQPGSDRVINMNLTKLDSGTAKHKRKDSADLGFSASGEGTDWDQGKFMTITKNKVYKLEAGNGENASRALFSVIDESKEKRQTLLGKMLSKNDEGKDEVLNYKKSISGIITAGKNAPVWQFNLDDLPKSNNTENLPFFTSPVVSGFLKNDKDSLFFRPSSFNADAILMSTNGDHIAAVKYRKKPLVIWVRKDTVNSLQDAIAVLFAVMISAK